VPAGRIDDRQAPMAKAYSGFYMAAITIWTAVPDSVGHRPNPCDFRCLLRSFGEDPRDAAHAACSVPVVAGIVYPIGWRNRSGLPLMFPARIFKVEIFV
jgi:hypothetical protein